MVIAALTTGLGVITSLGNGVTWPFRRAGRVIGITTRPYILLGNLVTVALFDDPRVGYDSWWHVECINKQRGGAAKFMRTAHAEGCRAKIVFRSLYDDVATISDDGVFLQGASVPPTEAAELEVDRPYPIPLYWQIPTGALHPFTKQPLPTGTYMTGAEFLYQNDLVARSRRLQGGTYMATVKITWNREVIAEKEFEINARAPLPQPSAPLTTPVPRVRRREPASSTSENVLWIEDQTYVSDIPRVKPHCEDYSEAPIRLVPYDPRQSVFQELSELWQVQLLWPRHSTVVPRI